MNSCDSKKLAIYEYASEKKKPTTTIDKRKEKKIRSSYSGSYTSNGTKYSIDQVYVPRQR